MSRALLFTLAFGLLVAAGKAEPPRAADAATLGGVCEQTAGCVSGTVCEDTEGVLEGQCSAACNGDDTCRLAFGDRALCIGGDLCVLGCASGQACPDGTTCNAFGWCERRP